MMKCYVCSGDCEREVIHGPYSYWRCSDCFTSQVLPQVPEDELQQYYDSFHLNESAGGLYDEVEDRMKADFPAKVDMVCRYRLSKSPRLLDVGCGKGFFVKAASFEGIHAEVMDVLHSALESAVRTVGVKSTEGSL